MYVASSQAEFEVVEGMPAPPSVVWDYLNSPGKRIEWQGGVTRVDQENPGGRPGVGTTNHCAHGDGTLLEQVLDWRPFRYVTKRMVGPKLFGPWVWTVELHPSGDGSTRVHVRGEKLAGLRRFLYMLVFQRRIVPQVTADLASLRTLLQARSNVEPSV